MLLYPFMTQFDLQLPFDANNKRRRSVHAMEYVEVCRLSHLNTVMKTLKSMHLGLHIFFMNKSSMFKLTITYNYDCFSWRVSRPCAQWRTVHVLSSRPGTEMFLHLHAGLPRTWWRHGHIVHCRKHMECWSGQLVYWLVCRFYVRFVSVDETFY
jgi:hypothetical protein